MNRKPDIAQPDWQDVFRLGEGHGVQAFLYKKLTDAGAEEPVKSRWEGLYKRQAFSNLLLAAEILQIDQWCRDAGIPCYFYKGKVWSEWLFGDLNTRGPGDIDLMVPREYLFRVIDVLTTRGYVVDPFRQGLLQGPDSVRKAFLRTDYHIPLYKTDEDGRLTQVVEVHWKIAYPRLCFDFDPEEFGHYETTLPFQGRAVRALTNEYQFLMLLVHHGGKERWNRLRYMVDLTGYLDRYGRQTDWDGLAALAHKKGVFTLLKWSLGILRAFDCPSVQDVPAGFAEKVKTARLLREWQELEPLPENATWSYFLHALSKRDLHYTPDIVKAHFSFLSEVKLHLYKLKWYREAAVN